MTLRAPCKCGIGGGRTRPLRSCGNHAEMLASFTLALEGWHLAEIEFFAEVAQSGVECCGTIDGCPLAAVRARPELGLGTGRECLNDDNGTFARNGGA